MPDRAVLTVAVALLAAFLFGSLLLVAVARPAAPSPALPPDALARLETRLDALLSRQGEVERESAEQIQRLEERIERLRATAEDRRPRADFPLIQPREVIGAVRIRYGAGPWIDMAQGAAYLLDDTACISTGPGAQMSWSDQRGNSGVLQGEYNWRGGSEADCRHGPWPRPLY